MSLVSINSLSFEWCKKKCGCLQVKTMCKVAVNECSRTQGWGDENAKLSQTNNNKNETQAKWKDHTTTTMTTTITLFNRTTHILLNGLMKIFLPNIHLTFSSFRSVPFRSFRVEMCTVVFFFFFWLIAFRPAIDDSIPSISIYRRHAYRTLSICHFSLSSSLLFRYAFHTHHL